MKKSNRLFALLLALAMVVTYMPAMAFATGPDDTDDQSGSEAVQEYGMEIPVQAGPAEVDPGDSDELLMQYFEKQFKGDADGGSPKIKSRRASRGSQLKDNDELIYNYLTTAIKEIADGNEQSAKVLVPMSEILGEDLSFEYEGEDPWEAQAIVYHATDIVNALLTDLPYDFYWYDKTTGYLNTIEGGLYKEENSYFFKEDENPGIAFYFSVAEAYRGTKRETIEYNDGEEWEVYDVDTEKTDAPAEAASNAREIVDKAGGTDFDILNYYKDRICELTTYNDKAADEEDTPYGDPWQMIWVFDGDPDTTVVCEGYSKAFQFLCDNTEFSSDETDAFSVTGTMTGGEGAGRHMWNIVHMDDNNYYLVDVTNCDEGTIGADDKLFLKGALAGGSVADGYGYDCTDDDDNDPDIYYEYDNTTISQFNDDELTMSESDYDKWWDNNNVIRITGENLWKGNNDIYVFDDCDSVVTFDLNWGELDKDDYDLEASLGTARDWQDENKEWHWDWDNENYCSSGTDYELALSDDGNSGTVTLHGVKMAEDGKLYEETEDGEINEIRLRLEIRAVDKNSHDVVSDEDVWIHGRKTEYNYGKDDWEILVNTGFVIDKFEDAYIENKDYPGGRICNYEVTNVTSNNQDVVEVEKVKEDDSDSDEYWWNIKALAEGEAEITVEHKLYDGSDSASYKFKVYAKEEIFVVDLWANSQGITALAGDTMDLEAKVTRQYLEEEVNENGDVEYFDRQEEVTGSNDIGFAWSIGDGDDAEYAAIKQDYNDPFKATVTFDDYNAFTDQIDENGHFWKSIKADVVVKKGNVNVASNDIELNVTDDFTEIFTFETAEDKKDEYLDLNTDIDVGESTSARFRTVHWFLEKSGEGESATYTKTPEFVKNVDYKVGFDEDFAIIKYNGEPIEYEEPITDDSDDGEGIILDITRLRKDDGDFQVTSIWPGETYGTWRRYNFDWLEYDIWTDNHDMELYSDSSSENAKLVFNHNFGQDINDRFDVLVEAGRWEDDGDGENGRWVGTMLEKDTDFTYGFFNGNKEDEDNTNDNDRIEVTLTDNFLNGFDEGEAGHDDIRVLVTVYPKGTLNDDPEYVPDRNLMLADRDSWFHLHQAGVWFDFEDNNEEWKLPGWDGNIDAVGRGNVQNSNYPDEGADFNYNVESVEVIDGLELLKDGSYNTAGEGEAQKFYLNKKEDNDWGGYVYNIKERDDLEDDFDGGDIKLRVTYTIPEELCDESDNPEEPAPTTATYDYTVHVVNDIYDVWLNIKDSKDDALPGETLNVTVGGHHEFLSYIDDQEDGPRWEYDDNDSNLRYELYYVLGSELPYDLREYLYEHLGDLNDIGKIPADKWHALSVENDVVSFARKEDGSIDVIFADGGPETENDEVYLMAQVYGSDSTEAEDADYCKLLMHSRYDTVYPLELPDLDFGATLKNQFFEVREYWVEGNATDGYSHKEKALDDVTLRFVDFDEGVINIYDLSQLEETEEGTLEPKQIHPGDESTGKRFNIVRVGRDASSLGVEAFWKEDGEDQYNREDYWFNDKYYRVEFEHDSDRVFTDGTLDYRLNMKEGFNDDWADNYKVDFTVGQGRKKGDTYVWDGTFAKDTAFSVDSKNNVVTLIGSGLKDHVDENDLIVAAEVKPISANETGSGGLAGDSNTEPHVDYPADYVVCSEDNWFSVSDPEFDFPQKDEYMLRGDGCYINDHVWYHGGKGDEEENGRDVIVSDVVVTNGESVTVTEKPYNDDENNDRTGWDLQAVANGDSTVKVTYTDPYDDSVNEYVFTMHVKSDLYEVHLDSVNGKFCVEPGESIKLKAYALHKFTRDNEDGEGWYYDETDKGMTFEWTVEVDPDSELAELDPKDVATLTDDPEHSGDTSRKVLTFADAQTLGNARGGVTVKFRVLDAKEQPVSNMIDVGMGYQSVDWMMDYYGVQDEYTYIKTAMLEDPCMEVGDSEIIDVSVMYKSAGEQAKALPGDIMYEWSFDEGDPNDDYDGDAVWIDEVISEGNDVTYKRIHNGDRTKSTKFRITRKTTGYARLVLHADGGMMQCWHAYYLDPKGYSISMDDYDGGIVNFMPDQAKTLSFTFDGFSNDTEFGADLRVFDNTADRIVEVEGIPQNAVKLTETQTGANVTVSADALEVLEEKNIDRFYVAVYAKRSGEVIWEEYFPAFRLGEIPEFYVMDGVGKKYEDNETLSIQRGKKAFIQFAGGGKGYIIGWRDTIPSEDDPEKMTGDLSDLGFTVTQDTAEDHFGLWIDTADLPANVTEGSLTYTLHVYTGDNLEQDIADGRFDWATDVPVASHTLNVEVTEVPHVHTMVKTEEKAATCTEAGNNAYWTCSGCGKYFSDEAGEHEIQANSWVINALGHKWGEASYTWSDDNSEVTATRVCANNSSHRESEPVETTSKVTKAPTCDAAGDRTYTSKAFMNSAFVIQKKTVIGSVPATGHEWGEVSFTWSDDNSQVTATRVCANDSDHKQTETKGTSYSVVQAAGCETEGSGRYTTTFTNADFNSAFNAKEVAIPATGHSWGAWKEVQAASETETGLEERVCANDPSHKETRVIPVLAHRQHNPKKVDAVEAGCETDGNKAYWKCSGCGKLFEDEAGTKESNLEDTVIKAAGHNWGKASYTWDEHYSSVNAVRECSKCGSTESETVKAVSKITTEPTCEAKGVRTYSPASEFTNGAFKISDVVSKTEEIDALGHKFGAAEYSWSEDYRRATATRRCSREGCSKQDTETVTTTSSSKEETVDEAVYTVTTYKAKFSDGTEKTTEVAEFKESTTEQILRIAQSKVSGIDDALNTENSGIVDSSDKALEAANDLDANDEAKLKATIQTVTKALEDAQAAVTQAQMALNTALAALEKAQKELDDLNQGGISASGIGNTVLSILGLKVKTQEESMTPAKAEELVRQARAAVAQARLFNAAANSALATAQTASAKVEAAKCVAIQNKLNDQDLSTEKKAELTAEAKEAAEKAAVFAREAEQTAKTTVTLVYEAKEEVQSLDEGHKNELDALDGKAAAAKKQTADDRVDLEDAEEIAAREAAIAEADNAVEKAGKAADTFADAASDAKSKAAAVQTSAAKAKDLAGSAFNSYRATDVSKALSAINSAKNDQKAANTAMQPATKLKKEADDAVEAAAKAVRSASGFEGFGYDAANQAAGDAAGKAGEAGRMFNDASTAKTEADTNLKNAETLYKQADQRAQDGKQMSYPKVKISKPKAAKKAFTVKWKKLTKAKQKKIGGIEVQYSTSSNFAYGNRTFKPTGKGKSSLKIKGLKAKTKYYVRVRSYKMVNGVKTVSAWSSKKSIKTK